MKNLVYKNAIVFSVFSFFNSGISFLLLLVLTYFLSPGDYGRLNLYTTLISFLTIIITLNSTGIIGANYFISSKKDITKTINSIFIIELFVFFLLLIIVNISSEYTEKWVGLSSKYQNLALIFCFFQAYYLIALDIWRLEEKPVTYGIYSFLFVFFNTVLTLLLVVLLDFGWIGRVYSQILIALVFFFISLFLLYKNKYINFKIIPSRKSLLEVLNFGIPLIPHGVSWWIRQGVDRYFINMSYDISLVGYFSFAANLANILQLIGMAFNASFSVFIYKMLSSDEKDKGDILLKQTNTMILLYFSLFIIITLFSFFLTHNILLQYSQSDVYIIPLCLSSFFQCIYLLFVNYLFYYKKTKTIMVITTLISFTHFIMSFFLIRYNPIWGGYISLISNFLIALVIFIYSNKYFSLPWKSFFKIGTKK